MAAMAPAKPKHMYRWWWDSHISPKNSKWLQENLTDMDAKVTQMIKLIEEDADSFARRAEMYYKKRPELMKMVEEFYRAYRALAERYDHATGALRQAHRTMTETFPNQVPSIMGDESPAASATEGDPRTPDLSPFRLLHDPDESHKVAAGPGGRARKGLSFQDVENHEWGGKGNGNHDPKRYVESERFSKAELEISTLKNALSKLEAEKEASHLQYQQTLEKLSSLESEVSRMTEDSRGVREQARKADEEAQNLKDVLAKLETEREDVMVQLQQYEDRISNLEKTISQAQKDTAEAEADSNTLKQETDRLEAEKESALVQHKQLLEKISEREAELLHAEEDARKAIELAGKAESEAENLRQMLAKLTEEKEVASVQYLQCLETIAALERKLAVAEEEKQKLKLEKDDTVSKFKDAEERCLLLERSNQSMHSEMESKSHEMAVQREELAVKQQELGVLWNSLQEERLRFVEAETAFQTLQHLHSQSQDELRSLAAEFQKQNQMLGDLESYNQRSQNEVEHIKGENKGLNEVNLSSAMTIQELQAKILKLRDTIGELKAEVELRVDQRNALQQEIYCLKEELNQLKKNHLLFVEQVKSVGFSPVSLVEDVKDLLDVNMKLKEDCEKGTGEKATLMEKLVVMNELVEKNALLEKSLSDLNVELEGVRNRAKVLEGSCQSLQGEKSSLSNETSTLVSQLYAANDNLERTVEKNSSLENSLLDTRHELEALQVKLKSLQDSCSVLENEKSNLAKEAEDLKASLAAEKHGHATLAKISETQLTGMELEISEVREELQQKSIEFDTELKEATNAQIEIFVMEESIQDFVKKNFALLVEFQKLLEASQLSKKLVSELQNEKVDRDIHTRSLFEQINMLREGLYQVLKALDADQSIDDIEEEDKALLGLIVNKLKATQFILCDMQDDKQKFVIENSLLLTLVRELHLEVENIVSAKIAVDQQYSAKCEQFLLLQTAGQKLAETNKELEIKLTEKEHEEAEMKDELRSMQEQLLDLEGAHLNLRDEKIKVLDEQSYLMKLVSDSKLEKHNLEEEYLSILSETICQGTLSTIFQDFVSESSMALKELSHDRDEVLLENGALKESAKVMEGKEAVLVKTIEEFRCKLEGLEVIRADQVRQIMKLSGECDQHKQQADSVHEAIQILEFELKHTADMLNNEVQSRAKEIDIMETEAEALLGQLQTSFFQAALLEGKIYDLADLCSHLEDKNHSSEIEIDQLKERVDIADAGNREIRSGVSMYAAAFFALKDSIGELENHTAPKRALSEVHGNETKESLVYEVGSHQQTSEEKISKLPYAASDLWALRTRIKAIENAVVGKERLLRLETEAYEPANAYPNGKELGSGRPKYTHEISEEDNEVISKDIMLDQVSERINFDAGNTRKLPAVRTKKEHSRERLSVDSLGEKELSIDRLDISKNFSGSRQDGDERKLLERLNSDSEKLISLDIVIQDLKKKVEVAEKSTKGKGMEYDRVKEQLEESEQAIKRLSEMNQNLRKTVEEDSSDQAGPMKRRRVSEQARRGSEKVGRLQLEVQKLQYLLAKLDDETKSKGKAKAAKKKKRVLLRDYLYGGTRTGPRRKKGHFCSCVRPATIGD